MISTHTSVNMPSTTSLDRKTPPDTPEEFLEMVIELDQRRKSQRLASQRSKQVCTSKTCEREIAAAGIPGAPGYRERASLVRQGHHALRLADEIERKMELRKHRLSRGQKEIRDAWKDLCNDKSAKSLLQRLGGKNGIDVSKAEMKRLINIFTFIFFPTTSTDAKMELDFAWQDWRQMPQEVGAYRELDKGGPLICMCAFNYVKGESCGSLNEIALDRLSTILHELIHAYLDFYACRCVEVLDSFEENVDQAQGHGRAWQRIASAIERAAPELLGYPLSMGRFESLTAAWKYFKHWPSREEVEGWQLVYSRGKEEEDEDEDMYIQCGGGGEDR